MLHHAVVFSATVPTQRFAVTLRLMSVHVRVRVSCYNDNDNDGRKTIVSTCSSPSSPSCWSIAVGPPTNREGRSHTLWYDTLCPAGVWTNKSYSSFPRHAKVIRKTDDDENDDNDEKPAAPAAAC